MAKLGKSSRFVAANALATFENRPHSLVNRSQATDLAPPAEGEKTLYVPPDAEPKYVLVQEAHAPYDAFCPIEASAFGVRPSRPTPASKRE